MEKWKAIEVRECWHDTSCGVFWFCGRAGRFFVLLKRYFKRGSDINDSVTVFHPRGCDLQAVPQMGNNQA
ncbi:MAG: hypothetical protein FWG57_09030 [Endomicrobia bacterium]|nr:hypothetical protein [Endomicrobiia bacterium]